MSAYTRLNCNRDSMEMGGEVKGLSHKKYKMAMYAVCCLEDNFYDFDDETWSLMDFYLDLRDSNEGYPLGLTDPEETIAYRKKQVYMDKELKTSIELDVLTKWLEAIEGSDLMEYVLHVFGRDLKVMSLIELCQKIINN